MSRLKSVLVGLVMMGVAVQASAQTLHSKVEAKAESKAGQVVLTFVVKADAGNVINEEAPWKLELKKYDGLKIDAPLVKGLDVVKSLPMLTVKAAPVAASGSVEWTLVAFVCSKDKTNCYRDVHNGKLPWKK